MSYGVTRRERVWIACFWLLLIVLAAIALLGGCAARTAVTPARSSVTITETVREPLQPLGPMGPGVPPAQQFKETTRTQVAESTGPGLAASGEKIVTEFDATAPEVALDGKGGGKARGGGFSLDQTVTGWLGFSPLFVLGGLCLAGAAVAFYWNLRSVAAMGAIAGGALVALSLYPSLVLAGLLIAGLLAVLLWAGRKGLLSREALRAVVAGVSASDKMARDAVKRSIGHHADERDRRTIRAVKVDDGLGGES